EHIDLPRHLWKNFKGRLNDFINLQGWHFPRDILLLLLALGINIQNIQCNPSSLDTMIWKLDILGIFSTRNTYETLCNKEDSAWW
ncbi:hypothetical protein GIB67_040423, partial [Kingdonia uniflora]